MSWSPCPVCGGMLEGHPGSACAVRGCLNSRENRARANPRVRAPLTGQVTSLPDRDEREKRQRKARRQRARAARRQNRRAA